ncbi:MAG: hypothetical protein K0S32_339 [Bacteroidetes bacterium]|jgi:hypothetical protein|nr:hypothetical protein [Bacteroidota bacterium]
MRKIFTLVCSSLISCFAIAQSVPNGGFESWQVGNFEDPINYQTSNTDQKEEAINQPGFFFNTSKTTDAYAGQYAIKLTTATAGTATVFGFFANGNPDGAVFKGGIPYSQKPTGLRFYYKSTINGTDSALVLLRFKKNGVQIGSYIYKFTQSKTVYTLFNQTLSPALPMNPDTIMIACASSNAFLQTGFVPGNMMQVDSLSFTGVASQPALLNGNFENWISKTDYKLPGWRLSGDFQRTTDFFSGNFALELQTAGPSFGDNSVRTGIAMTGIPSQTTTLGGTPFSNQIDTLVFYYKYLPATPQDSGRFFANFKKNGVFIGNLYKKLGVSASYQAMVIPFNLSQAPDTVQFSFESSMWPAQFSYIGSDLKVDNFYMKSQKLPISSFITPPVGCVGQPVQLIDNSFNMANAWGWIMPGGNPGSSTAQNPVVIYNTAGTKTITMICSNQFGSSATISKTISINPIPPVVSSSSVTPCGGSNVVLTASGANTYTWNTGALTSTISAFPNVTTTYTVTGTTNGCSSSAVGVIVVPGVPKPEICMVTVDSANVNNHIYWNKQDYPMLDSMIIEREVIANTYKRIGVVSKNAISMFIDTTRSVGPANGDPNISTYRYKIQIRDTCGSYGPKSDWHNTVYFTHTGGTFFWTNNYMIEGGINPVQTYSLMVCVNPTVSPSYSLVGTTTGNQSTLNDPFYNIYQATADWRVEADLGYACNATMKPIAGQNVMVLSSRSRSNIQNNRTIGMIENLMLQSLKMYPNPSNAVINLEMIGQKDDLMKAGIVMTNILGSVVYKGNFETNIKSIDVSQLAKGIYTLTVSTPNARATYKVVVN